MELYPDGGELVWCRLFPGRPDQAGAAREFVAYLLGDLPNVDDAVLVTSEFVSNALRHTASAEPGGRFLLEVRRRADGATVAVADQGSQKRPAIPALNDLSEGGRGLYTAQAVATRLTWARNQVGHVVTAAFHVGTGDSRGH